MPGPPQGLLVESLHPLHRIHQARKAVCADGLKATDGLGKVDRLQRREWPDLDHFPAPEDPGVVDVLPEETHNREDEPVPKRRHGVLRKAPHQYVPLIPSSEVMKPSGKEYRAQPRRNPTTWNEQRS